MAQYPTEYGTTPVGRIVMCNREGIFAKGTKDKDNRDIPLDKQCYFVGLAIEKTAPGLAETLGILQKAASEGYASNPMVMQQVNAGLNATAFTWKVQDGDAMVQNPTTGQMEPRTPNARGCFIFKFKTTIDMTAAKWPAGAAQATHCDPSEMYKGCFAMISFSTSANGNADHTAGIYLNPKTICFVGHGEPIVGGPSLEAQFSGAAPGAYMPAGMSQTPLVPAGSPPAAGMPPMGAPPSAPAAPGMAQPPMGGAAPVAPAGNPMAAPAPGMAAPAPGMAAPAPGMAAPAPGMAAPAPGMAAPAPGNPAANPMMAPGAAPAPNGGEMPAPNAPGMATGSPVDPNGQPQAYGGYMNPQG